MSEQPIMADAPPPAAPEKKGFPRWLLIVGGIVVVLGLLCCLAFVLASLVLGPAVEQTYLALNCGLYTGQDSAICTEWAADVQDTPEYRACRDQAMSGNRADPDLLYNCLVEQGLGPE